LNKPFFFIILFGVILVVIGVTADKWERPYTEWTQAAYGELYYTNQTSFDGMTIPLAVNDTFFNVTYLRYGNSNDGTYLFNKSKIRVLEEGQYLISMSAVIKGGSSKHYGISMFINGVWATDCGG
jgi:hypothetical protein